MQIFGQLSSLRTWSVCIACVLYTGNTHIEYTWLQPAQCWDSLPFPIYLLLWKLNHWNNNGDDDDDHNNNNNEGYDYLSDLVHFSLELHASRIGVVLFSTRLVLQR